MYDIVIRNGWVIDGSANPWYKTDLAVDDGLIVQIGRLDAESGDYVLDASKLVVAPGFIDLHSHSEMWHLYKPDGYHKVIQGITTDCTSNCGFSPAPVNDHSRDFMKKTMSFMHRDDEIEWDWFTMSDLFSRYMEVGTGVNIAQLVGHATLRAYAMEGMDRPSTDSELRDMMDVLSTSLSEGAVGLSAGLIFPPSSNADSDELSSLCEIVKAHNGFFTMHIRSEGEYLIEAVSEVLEIGRKTDVRINLSHHKALGKGNWGKVERTLRMIDEAREEGIEVTLDIYPYNAGSGGLTQLIPLWVFETGRIHSAEQLKKPEIRQRIMKGLEESDEDWAVLARGYAFDQMYISKVLSDRNRIFEGKSIREMASMRGVEPMEAVFDLLIEEDTKVAVVGFFMSEEDVSTIMAHQATAFGSDGMMSSNGSIHPRTFGTFPRVLGKYVREERTLTLQDAVRKMTSLPARVMRLKNRGMLKEGFKADITIFDPNRIIDLATFKEPDLPPEGIVHVLVNGRFAVFEGNPTGELNGEIAESG